MEEKSDKLTFQNQNRHVVSIVACPPGILPTISPLRSCHVVSLGVRTSSSLLQIAGVRTDCFNLPGNPVALATLWFKSPDRKEGHVIQLRALNIGGLGDRAHPPGALHSVVRRVSPGQAGALSPGRR